MRKRLVVLLVATALLFVSTAHAFYEDICLPRRKADGTLSWCLTPTCPGGKQNPNRACLEQTFDFLTVKPGRSTIHHDATYFLAQALGYRADVAYWIAAYNEVTDYTQYVPIDQCGVQASSTNTGGQYITAQFNGFQRTNTNTDGPLDHYVLNFSPNGQGTDVHGAGGVQSLYPFHYPQPGYPLHIDDTYQKTLANLRQWAMIPSEDPGLLCTVGLMDPDDPTKCLTGTINGHVPLLLRTQRPYLATLTNVPAGKKVLNWVSSTSVTYYDELGAWLRDPSKTSGKLWLDKVPRPVPVQLARLGLYLHVLQDTSSHATYCGDDAPSPPGGTDVGTYMYLTDGNQVNLSFGASCANAPHLAGHLQETGTGDNPLPLRVYVALNNTVDELIAFGPIAKQHGWLSNPDLMPPNHVAKSAYGQTAAQIKAQLVGTIVSGTPYSRAEVYKSGVVTKPIQNTNSLERLHRLNLALANYSVTLQSSSANSSKFVPLASLPGNSPNPGDKSVCWQPLN